MYNIMVWNALCLIQLEGQRYGFFRPMADMGHVGFDTGDMGFRPRADMGVGYF